MTGHSLGAAIATFAALDIKEQLNPTNRFDFYTFGSPRTGDETFTDYIFSHFPSNGSYYRVTHLNDLVPHSPSIEEGFNHAGDEVWYNDAENPSGYKICRNHAGVEESWDCSNSYYVYDWAAHMEYLGLNIKGQCTIPGTPTSKTFLE